MAPLDGGDAVGGEVIGPAAVHLRGLMARTVRTA
jgi:hypothetical protein